MSQVNDYPAGKARAQRPMFDQEGGAHGGQSQNRQAPPHRQPPRGQSAPAQGRRGVPRGGQNGSSGRSVYQSGAAAGAARRPRPQTQADVHRSARTVQRQKKRKRRRRITAIVVLCLILGIVGGIYALYHNVAEELKGENTEAGPVPEEVKTLEIPEYTGKNIVCGLVCGIDYNNEDANGYLTDDKTGRTDMIMYVMYDTNAGKVNILQIPRDTFVGNELNTGGSGKINALYYNSEDPNARMTPLLTTIKDQLGLPVDFYATIDMDGLKEIVDIKGWIEVYVPHDVVDKEGNVLEAGWQNLPSDKVEYLLRNRNYADADLGRLQTQLSFYSALFREFKGLQPADLVRWMAVLLYRCNVGGMGPLDLGGLAQKALNVQGEDVMFIRPPVTGASNGGHDVVCLVPDETAELLNEYFRPEGYTLDVDELDIHTLPVLEHIGKAETTYKTMAGIMETEPDKG